MDAVSEVGSSGGESSAVAEGVNGTSLPDRHGFLGGTQYSPEPRPGPPSEVVLRRERKWLHMLQHWNEYMETNYRKVRERCRKGIPMSVRPRAWLYLCGGKLLLDRHPHLFADYCRTGSDALSEQNLSDIRKDLHRQFPTHEMFATEHTPGQHELFRVLCAYCVHNPKVGYCQAQAPVAAFLVMHMPAVEAFWCLVSVSDRYLEDYYSPSMEVVQRDARILHALLKRVCPAAHRHLERVHAEPMFYCTEWFLCAFTRTLPWDTLLRVWDVFVCEGVKVLFKTALVIVTGCLGTAERRRQCSGLLETLTLLRQPPDDVVADADNLIYNIRRLDVSERDFEREHKRQTERMRRQLAAEDGPSRR